MKIIKYLLSSIIILFLVTGCKKENYFKDLSFLSTAKAPSNLGITFDTTNDNSGNVTINPYGTGVGFYNVYFGDTTANPVTIQPGNNVLHRYAEGKYSVKLVAHGIAGDSTEKSFSLSVIFRAPVNLMVTPTVTGHTLQLVVSAEYAKSYLVYFGDVVNEVGTPIQNANGGTVTHDYASAGIYKVRVVALSGGAATSEKIIDVTIYEPMAFPITFEYSYVNYSFGTFGGFLYGGVVANPSPSGLDTSANVGEFIKPVGAQSWAGTYSFLNIDFSKGNKIKIWVYNPDPANIGKKLVVELKDAVGGSPANGTPGLQQQQSITTSGAWEELVFDYSNVSAINNTTTFTTLILQYNLSAPGSGETFYLDNFRFTY